MKQNYKQQLHEAKNNWLSKKFIAHRGLWDNQEIIENTLPAFQNAINHNYAIELDVWRIKDGTLVVYHDDTLKRLCGIDKKICDVESVEELKSYSIFEKEKIPTFDEFLELVNSQTQILVEIKTYEFNGKTEELIYNRLKNYSGDYAIESFNCYSVYWFKKNAPHIFRGQLSAYFEDDKKISFLMKNIKKGVKTLFFNKFTKPHFVAYDKNKFPNKYISKAQKQGLPILLWTIKNQEEYLSFKDKIDNVIFDTFLIE